MSLNTAYLVTSPNIETWSPRYAKISNMPPRVRTPKMLLVVRRGRPGYRWRFFGSRKQKERLRHAVRMLGLLSL